MSDETKETEELDQEQLDEVAGGFDVFVDRTAPVLNEVSLKYPIEHDIKPTINIDGKKLEEGFEDPVLRDLKK